MSDMEDGGYDGGGDDYEEEMYIMVSRWIGKGIVISNCLTYHSLNA